jgi:tryptophan-rich sensory protein
MESANFASGSVDAKPSTARRVLGTALAVVMCNAVGIAGAFFTSTDTAWYQSLQKPAFQPPGWVFGPAWTLLYSLMGIALYRVFEKRSAPTARVALGFFAAQLFLNGIWSPIFFGAQALTFALAIIGVLVVLVAVTIRQFRTVDRLAAWLLVPYLAWLCFATTLNATIVALN